ncbi:hypothetical protein J5U46_25235 [Micromonospora tulbaghiae]|uniref:TerY-C metal binding domain n=1 Tax=Micromonospora tulbaghiae TaxID=479978 RepID=A0AAW4JTT7_9ACTN|nr:MULTISPECIES: hypothetical protein [Micromonospora]KAB1904567.1 hypothetical protein F8279_20730 [Micromonospora sp. AMSO1212t]MBO4143460.1 hypothetical protein [Micromonospora tulbaghiae]MDX5456090.1 hypothetical protein [Micromonospora tulbaghiae]SCE71591.1 TerY-C metal binding domain [Micromonospora tulbaghiae]
MTDDALFVSMVCSSTRLPAVIRFRWDGECYVATAGSKQRPGSVVPPQHGNGSINGSFSLGAAYPGCVYCGADNFVRCGRCRELGCHDHSWEVFNCPRCGNSGRVDGTIDSLSGLGSS